MMTDESMKTGKKRNWVIVLGVAIAGLAVLAAVAIATIKPTEVAVAVAAIVGLLMIAIGMLPRALSKRRQHKNA